MKRPAIFVILVFLALLITACQTTSLTESSTGEVESISLSDGSVLFFPRQPESDGAEMEALLEGQLIFEDGCLRATTDSYQTPGFLVLWPSKAEVNFIEGGIIEILNGNGEPIGRVGAPIRIGGGAMEDEGSMTLWEGHIDGLPIEDCPGPYWVAGALYPLAESGATATTRPLATPYAQAPASGICGEFEGSIVSVSLRPDVPDPRCVRVRPEQHLSVKNETDQMLQVSIAAFQAELGPGQEITFETPFGKYLAPGVHQLTTSVAPGGPEIWLVVEQSYPDNLSTRQPPLVIRETPGPFFETIFSIPIGEGGIRYRGADVPEMQVTGPIGLAVVPDGRFVIGDVNDNRLLWYDLAGNQLQILDLYSLDILNVSDLVATSDKLCLLEISFSIAPERYRVNCLSFNGEIISTYDIPKGYHFEDGLYGLGVGGEGEIMIEFYGEVYRLYQVPDQTGIDPTEIAGIPAFGRLYQVKFATQEGDMSAIIIENRKFVSEMKLGGLMKILAVNPDGSFYILREEMVADYPVIVGDQTVHYMSADGKQIGVARYPLSEWYSFIQRNLAVGMDGNVYALITRQESIDILRLNFYQEVGPLIPNAIEPVVTNQPLTGEEKTQPTITWNCLNLQHLEPDSPEAQQIVQEFMANFTKAYPTEYMGFEQLWSVDRLGEWAIIQGMVTVEEIDAIVVKQGTLGFEMVARYTATMPGPTHSQIPQYFTDQLPDSPPELFHCLDLSHFLG